MRFFGQVTQVTCKSCTHTCDIMWHERTWLRSLSSSCECARHRPDRRRGCLSLVQMLVSCNLGWPIGAPAACTYRIQANWCERNSSGYSQIQKEKCMDSMSFFDVNTHTLMPCWAATGDDATDSTHPHGDLSEFEAIFADFRLAVPGVQMNLTFVFQSFAPTLLSCIDLRLHYVTSLSTLCVRPGFACDLHRFMATWKAFNSCWTARQMLWPLILLGSHFCATLFAMCCLDSSWDLNWKHRKYAEQKNEHWKLSLRRVCFEFMGSFQFHFPGPLSLFIFHSGLLYHRTPSLKWHWMAATSSISLYLLNLLSFLQTSGLHVEPKFRNLVVSDRPDLQTMFGRRRTWDFHTSSQRGCVRPCGTSTLGFWKWRGSKRWDGKNASECHKRNVWIGIAIILYHFFMWNFQIFANSHIFHPDVSCLEIPGNSARQYLRSSAYYALQRPWHPVFNMIQQCSTFFPIIQPKRFSVFRLRDFLGDFELPWRSEPEVTPEAQGQLCRNFSLTMLPDLLRYWWATGARGLRLCRRLFVEADTLHKIWFQAQSQNLELLEFDVAQKKEFIEYIWGHRRNRYTKHQSRICLDLMLFSAILSVRSPPPLCEGSKLCVTSIIVDHLCILSFAFVSSCRLSARQLGVTHVHLDQAALRRSSREKVRTASKHRNLPELQMTVATVATVHPKLFSAPGLQWLRLEVGQWALESYATVELFLSLSFMMPMQFDVHSHSHLLLSSELSTFSILALHPARC